jgi:transposase-like protein
MIRSHNPSFHFRYRLVQAALQHGIRSAARAFGCSRNTVRTWLRLSSLDAHHLPLPRQRLGDRRI